MDANRAILGGSFVSVLFLLAGTFLFPASPIMWLAGMTPIYTTFRAIMCATLLMIFFTKPPRKLYVRLGLGALAAILVGWGVTLAFVNNMQILDVVLFIELGIAFGITALEVTEDQTAKPKQAKSKGHRHTLKAA